MATFLLLPNATGVSSAHWVVSADTRHECLDDDNGNTSYVSCDNHGVSMILEYADPSVDEGDIDSDAVLIVTSHSMKQLMELQEQQVMGVTLGHTLI